MESHLVPGDPILVKNIVSYLKAMGIFDEFRHECLADVDTKSSCQNLSQRVDGYTSKFLANETWNPDLNKNEVRNKLRKHIDESGMLAVGADHVVEQVINPKIHQLFLPKIIEVVHQYLDKEKEKLNQKPENINSEKISTETITKPKITVLDPIADILSFTCSKPKSVASTSVKDAQAKISEASKVEKKKEETAYQTKTPDPIPKTEKKKEEIAKPPDVLPKIKKEEDETSNTDNMLNSEKKDDISSIKTETIELPKEVSSVLTPQPKSLDECKELEKFAKPIKVEDGEASFETPKKAEKEEVKQEKKKVDSLKLQIPEKLLQSEKNTENKSSSSVKSSSSSKSKHKRNKPLGLGVVKPSTKVVESNKSVVRESSDSSSDKPSMDPNKVLSNVHLKDRSALKNTISVTMVKCEKSEDSASKSKPKSSPNKPSDKPASSKVGTLKKEDSSVKLKHSSEKHEKTKTIKVSDSKSDVKIHSESSSSSDKGSKQSSHYSSSYDSSQGSDPDKSHSNVGAKEKLKHFSKHQRKVGSSTDKPSPDKKSSQSDSDSGTPKKDKGTKSSKYPKEEQKKSFTLQESAKITSRSDSIGSASSTSDSQSSLKEASISISSEDTSDSSSKSSKKKKQASKDREPCSDSKNLPPPSPPPPTSGLSTQRASSAEMSSVDETSQESEFESSEDVGSESEEENSVSSSSNQELSLKPTEVCSNVFDASLFYSSSSEFEEFNSSPEKSPDKFASDDDSSVSSVHTTDLSSFEDELSDVELSNVQSVEGKSKKRLTIKEAQEILKDMTEQQRLEALKTTPPKTIEDKKNPKNSPQNPAAAVEALPEVEVSPPPEPKRESRRERKLNPKYASSEYTSIFDSLFPAKGALSNRRKSSVATSDKNLSNDVGSKVTSLESDKKFISLPSASRVLELSSEDISSHSQTKNILNASDKNHNSLAETDSPNRIALKIKLSAAKNDNASNKDPIAQRTKRKFEEEEEERSSAKRACHRNSVNSSTLESIANENKPFNNKSKAAVLSASRANDKEVFHKQKVNNGDVLNKIERVRKNSHTKPNHVIEKQSED